MGVGSSTYAIWDIVTDGVLSEGDDGSDCDAMAKYYNKLNPVSGWSCRCASHADMIAIKAKDQAMYVQSVLHFSQAALTVHRLRTMVVRHPDLSRCLDHYPRSSSPSGFHRRASFEVTDIHLDTSSLSSRRPSELGW
jgi:hypothetical protein